MSLADPFFHRITEALRQQGGDVEVAVRLKCGEPDVGDRSQYDGATVHVTLTYPFTHGSVHCEAVGKGKSESTEHWLCFSKLHKRAKIETLANDAAAIAVSKLAESVKSEILTARPSTSAKRITRRTRALLRALNADKEAGI